MFICDLSISSIYYLVVILVSRRGIGSCSHLSKIIFGVKTIEYNVDITDTIMIMQADVFLICSNAMQYNAADTVYYRQVCLASLYSFSCLPLFPNILNTFCCRHDPFKIWREEILKT